MTYLTETEMDAMITEIEKYRILGTPESIADRLKAAGCRTGLIDKFAGTYAFLSNFQACTVTWEGVSYGSVEAAFQAAKCAVVEERSQFSDCSPSEAKRMGRRCKLRPDWEWARLSVMETLVWQKFQNDPGLKRRLLETGDAELVEGNRWHDNFWGDCKCPKCAFVQGENRLGVILMNVRSKLRRMQDQTVCITLPDGTTLRAAPNGGFLYPGLSISIAHEDGAEDERLCFVELNPEKQEGHRLCIGVYNAAEDDFVYYEPYHPGTNEEDDE